jgi:septal ring factor EnvC (AmiA/AmiB activator)
MTTDERFERIEHVTAGIAEERRKDREEYRTLWRDTQRQLNDLTGKVADLGDRIAEIAEESRAADQRFGARMEEADRQSRERDARLGDRIESLASSIGALIARLPPPAA